MNHYDIVEWKLFKENLLDDRIRSKMEEHLMNCDECMEVFLSLIDENEIELAKEVVPPDFTDKVVNNIRNVRPIEKVHKKNKKTYNDYFIYYVAVASVAIFLTASGFFGRLVNKVPEISSRLNEEGIILRTNKIYDFSEKITRKTNEFVNNFNLNWIEED